MYSMYKEFEATTTNIFAQTLVIDSIPKRNFPILNVSKIILLRL